MIGSNLLRNDAMAPGIPEQAGETGPAAAEEELVVAAVVVAVEVEVATDVDLSFPPEVAYQSMVTIAGPVMET